MTRPGGDRERSETANRGRQAASLYRIDWDDMQISAITDPATTGGRHGLLSNAGRACAAPGGTWSTARWRAWA